MPTKTPNYPQNEVLNAIALTNKSISIIRGLSGAAEKRRPRCRLDGAAFCKEHVAVLCLRGMPEQRGRHVFLSLLASAVLAPFPPFRLPLSERLFIAPQRPGGSILIYRRRFYFL